jgi:predicted dinucleotide-binding enzyme
VKILFDQGTPAPLRWALLGHQVEAAAERDWATLKNGELIAAAESEGFEVFVTTDSNLKYQQNLAARQLAIVVLLTTSWPRIRQALPAVIEAVDAAAPGTYREVSVPRLA